VPFDKDVRITGVVIILPISESERTSILMPSVKTDGFDQNSYGQRGAIDVNDHWIVLEFGGISRTNDSS